MIFIKTKIELIFSSRSFTFIIFRLQRIAYYFSGIIYVHFRINLDRGKTILIVFYPVIFSSLAMQRVRYLFGVINTRKVNVN